MDTSDTAVLSGTYEVSSSVLSDGDDDDGISCLSKLPFNVFPVSKWLYLGYLVGSMSVLWLKKSYFHILCVCENGNVSDIFNLVHVCTVLKWQSIRAPDKSLYF